MGLGDLSETALSFVATYVETDSAPETDNGPETESDTSSATDSSKIESDTSSTTGGSGSVSGTRSETTSDTSSTTGGSGSVSGTRSETTSDISSAIGDSGSGSDGESDTSSTTGGSGSGSDTRSKAESDTSSATDSSGSGSDTDSEMVFQPDFAASEKVFQYDFAAKVNEALKITEYGRRIDVKGPMVEIELPEEIVDELFANNLANALYAEYSNALDHVVKKAADEVATLAEEHSGSDPDDIINDAQNILKAHAETLSDLHHEVPTNVISKLKLNASMEKQYKKALNRRRRNIVKSLVLTAASTAAIVLPGTQAFAIYSAARSLAGLFQEIFEHNRSITTAAKVLQKQLKILEVAFKKAAGRAVSETGGTTLNAALGIDLVPTLDEATSSLEDLKLNTGHAGHKNQIMIDGITGMMDGCAALDKIVSSLSEPDFKNKLAKSLIKNEAALDKMIKKAVVFGKHLNEVQVKLPALGKALEDLGKNSAAQDFANYTVKVLVNLGAIAGGGLIDATAATTACGSAVEGAEEIAAMTIASIGYADELRQTAENVGDLAKI